MRYGIVFPTKEHGTIDEMATAFAAVAAAGLSSAWVPNSSGWDAVTLLAVIGARVPGIELGTAVVPTYPRHPLALAAQALTASAACGGRFTLGIGLSHRAPVEGAWGYSYDKPARHMREYLAILGPALRERRADFAGETLIGRAQLTIGASAPTPPVLLAALQPHMLRLAGSQADGTITWCTGVRTVADHIVPTITAAAADAGRPTRVVVVLPCILTGDEADGRSKAGEQLAGYGSIPVYRAVLDREGAAGPADISLVGDEAALTAHLRRLADAGADDFVAILTGTAEERARTLAFLSAQGTGG